MSCLTPHDFPHTLNYNNLTITAKIQIYCVPKKSRMNSTLNGLSRFLITFLQNIFNLGLTFYEFSPPPTKFIFTYNSQSTCTISFKFFLSVRYINTLVWYKKYLKNVSREHAENCDVSFSPCPTYPRCPLIHKELR
jgi:hypothetical protein